MSVPKVSIAYANGNLLSNIGVLDGIAGLVINGTASGALALNTPVAVNNLNDVAALGITGIPVGITAATSTATVTGVGVDGDLLTITSQLASPVVLASYTKVSGDASVTAVATAIKNLINAGTATHGYTATNAAGVITITAPLSLGSSINTVAITLSGNVPASSVAFSGGVSETVNAVAYRHLKEYYTEVAGNQELWLMLVADTMTMAQMLDNSNANGAKKLLAVAGGKVRLLGLCRKPAGGYNAGNDFMDSDVAAAVLAAKTFCEARLAELAPVRILIEGRVANEASTTIYQPNAAAVGAAGVVLGGTLIDKSASVGLALGRAVKYAAHIKLGKVANGPLSILTAYIGTKPVKDVSNLATLHGYGYISFMFYAQKAGFYFGIDRMASTDDYRLLVYGRIVDKAAVIAATVYLEQLEGEVNTDATGKVLEADCKHLEDRLRLQVQANMADQISGFDAVVDPNQNIINTSTLKVQLKIRPKGYTSFINVVIGLNAGN